MGLNMTRLSDWIEWREKCAIDMCAEPVRQRLRSFVLTRFFGRANAVLRVSVAQAGEDEVIQSFEYHCLAGRKAQRKDGKVFKDAIFDAARNARSEKEALETIERFCSRLIQHDVVRRVAQEIIAFASRSERVCFVELDGARSGGEGGWTERELLPDPIDLSEELAVRDLTDLARPIAHEMWAELECRQRIARLAHYLGVSLAHEVVTTLAGCRKSQIYKANRAAETRLECAWRNAQLRLSREMPNEDASVWEALARLLLRRDGLLDEVMLEWGRAEKVCAPLFELGSDTPSTEM